MEASINAILGVVFGSGVPVWALMTAWVAVLLAALFALIRGSDMFVVGATQLGAAMGMSTFAIGVLIVGFGTSFPELASSIAAVMQGSTEIVVANVVGSNITNILLVVGVVVMVGGRIVIKRDLIKTELPIFFISTAHFVAVVYDGVVDRLEALLLVGTFSAYIWYLFAEAKDVDQVALTKKNGTPEVRVRAIVFILLGLISVLIGAHFAIKSVIFLGTSSGVPVSVISIFAIALGTSLPELFVGLKAVRSGHGELAIGSIFGSNAFNILMVVGIPGLFATLVASEVVMNLGLGILMAASAIFFVNGLARQIMRWEGMMMLLFFAFFILKLVDFL